MSQEFGTICYGEDDDLLTITEYELNDFDLVGYWMGKPLSDVNSDSLHAVVSGKSIKPSDYIFGPLSILAFSKRVVEFLDKQISEEFEVVNLDLFSEVGTHIPGFCLVNPLNTIKCLSAEATTYIGEGKDRTIIRPVIDSTKVPANISIFRIDGLPGKVIFRKELAKSILNAGFNGISFLVSDSVNDMNRN